jgi:hypothetical protein
MPKHSEVARLRQWSVKPAIRRGYNRRCWKCLDCNKRDAPGDAVMMKDNYWRYITRPFEGNVRLCWDCIQQRMPFPIRTCHIDPCPLSWHRFRECTIREVKGRESMRIALDRASRLCFRERNIRGWVRTCVERFSYKTLRGVRRSIMRTIPTLKEHKWIDDIIVDAFHSTIKQH